MKYKGAETATLKLLLNEYDKTIEKAIESFGEVNARQIFKETFEEYDKINSEMKFRQANLLFIV